MEQLNLFGEAMAPVQPASDSPLAGEKVRALLAVHPGLYLGTSSWSFPGWEELVYEGRHSEQSLARHGLRAYSKVPLFRTVSLDRTYYRPMTAEAYRELRQQVGPDFRFLVKAPRDLLKAGPEGFDIPAFYEHFLDPLREGLGETLGIVLLQFPPGTAAELGPGFVSHLARLLKGLPQDLSFSLEVRDEELLTRELQRAMAGTRASLCASIHPSLPTVDQQLLRVSPTPDLPLVFRWNLRPSLDYQEARNNFHPFRALALEDQGRRKLLARLIARALRAGRSVYLTANNKAEGCAPLTLLKFLEELSSHET